MSARKARVAINDLVNFEVRCFALACDPRGHSTRRFDNEDEARAHAMEMAEFLGEDVVYLVRCESLPFPSRKAVCA